MSFDYLQTSEVNYMIEHSFVDPEIVPIWKSSCQVDPTSAGCRYFGIRFQEDIDELNPYSTLFLIKDVYGYCYYNDSFEASDKKFKSQESILLDLKRKYSNFSDKFPKPKYNGAPCAYFDGMFKYFNNRENMKAYNIKFPDQKWNGPCVQYIQYLG